MLLPGGAIWTGMAVTRGMVWEGDVKIIQIMIKKYQNNFSFYLLIQTSLHQFYKKSEQNLIIKSGLAHGTSQKSFYSV